jgi:predicted aspartyl protease
MGHVFLRVMFIGKEMLEVDEMPVDTGAPFTGMPLDVAEKYFI